MEPITVRNWMTPNPITIPMDTLMTKAYRMMVDHKFRHLPIINPATNKVVGVVSKQQIRRVEIHLLTLYARSMMSSLVMQFDTVGEMPLPQLVTVGPNDTMEQASLLMSLHQLSALAVVADDQLVGILTESDVYRFVQEVYDGPSRRAE